MKKLITVTRRYTGLLLSGILLLVSSQGVMAAASADTYAITNLTVIDIHTGDRQVTDLLIKGERITAMGQAGELALPKRVVVIDAKGKYAFPGLWDAHAHIAMFPEDAKQLVKLYVAKGVTSIRDAGGNLKDLLALRQYAEQPGIIAPRLRFAGPIVDSTPRLNRGDHGKADISVEVNTPAEAVAMVDRLAEAGVDFIKPYQFLRPEVFAAIVQRARHHGLPLAGHIPSRMSIREVVELTEYDIQHIAGNLANLYFDGVKDSHPLPDRGAILDARTDESASDLVHLFHWPAKLVTPDDMDEQKMAALVQAFVRTGAWNTPTLSSATGFELLGLQDDPYVTNAEQYYCRQLRRAAKGFKDIAPREKETWDKIKEQYKLMAEYNMQMVNKLHRAGVPLLAGGESMAMPGFNIHLELQAMVKAGLSPLAALQTATLNPAKFFHNTEQQGSIAVGKLADMVIVDKDPLVDIANTRTISYVIAKGELLNHQRLEQLLEEYVEECRS